MLDVETRFHHRLKELRAEYEKGKKTLEELEGQAANVRATLLRISGAIQVLQEELEATDVSKDSSQLRVGADAARPGKSDCRVAEDRVSGVVYRGGGGNADLSQRHLGLRSFVGRSRSG
jgi:hypothetical protein